MITKSQLFGMSGWLVVVVLVVTSCFYPAGTQSGARPTTNLVTLTKNDMGSSRQMSIIVLNGIPCVMSETTYAISTDCDYSKGDITKGLIQER